MSSKSHKQKIVVNFKSKHNSVTKITISQTSLSLTIFWILFPDSIVDHVGKKMANNVTNISNTGMKMIIDNSRSKAIQSDK